jgi:putative heme iron utilization protein
MANEAVGNPGPGPGPGQDQDFDPVGLAKRLLRQIRPATLATLNEDGAPFATLTAVATDHDGAPILLMSRLAQHTRNLERDPRLSLLLAEGGSGDPLAHPRLTLIGAAARSGEPRLRARYLRRNPKAALYADFPDFSFWRVTLASVHLNGGFARAADFGPDFLLTTLEGAESLIAAEEETLQRLNAEQSGALGVLAHALGAERRKWLASGLDPEGLDLIAGDRSLRIAFPQRVTTPQALAEVLADLARAAEKA